MIFPGRQLASGDGLTIWEKYPGPGYSLHLVSRGIVLELSEAELAALAQIAPTAIRAAQTPEEPKDRARRLQILQARTADLIRRERP